MNQNRNTPYSHEFSVMDVQQMGGGLSIFNFQQSQDVLIKQNMFNRRNAFSAFLNSRNHYLSSLKSLGDNWISGSAKQPTEQSINLSKDLLDDIGNWYANKGFEEFVYPKIIMSPTPSGGIAMEIELFPELRAYVSIFNDKVNYEVEKGGYYVEIECDKNNLTNQLLNLYDSDEGRSNS